MGYVVGVGFPSMVALRTCRHQSFRMAAVTHKSTQVSMDLDATISPANHADALRTIRGLFCPVAMDVRNDNRMKSSPQTHAQGR